MYAARRLYVKQWEHEPSEERYSVKIERGGKSVPGIQPERIRSIDEEVMYWRKANHIHAWFVVHVQDSEDDCGEYHADWEALSELLGDCKKVIEASRLVDGMIDAGTVYDKDHPNGVVQRTPGKVIEDATVAKELLPTCPGFFFGSTEYDEEYLNEVKNTANWAAAMLQDKHDGVPGDIYYRSSW